jgi:hypothetical protein
MESEGHPEVAACLLDLLSECIEKTLPDALLDGPLSGEIGERDLSTLNYAALRDTVDFFQKGSEYLSYAGSLSVEGGFLLSIAAAVSSAREGLATSSWNSAKNAIAKLKEISEEYALPESLESELERMDTEISYQEGLRNMKAAIQTDGPVHYLVSSGKGRKRTVSTGRVGSASILSTSQSSAGYTPMSEAEEVIAEDDLCLNDTALETRGLEKALQQASQVQDLLESEELPEEFDQYISALDAIKKLRTAVKQFDWTAATEVLAGIERNNLVEVVPAIRDEVEAAREPVHNYAVITACKLALVKGQATGSIGMLDYRSMNLEALEEATRLCETLGCHTARATELCKGVQVITALRQAQKAHDWAGVRSVLKRAEAEGIGSEGTYICFSEIHRSMVERDNHELVEGLRNALMREVIPTKESIMDVGNATVNELTTAYAKTTNFPDDSRGPILKTLMTLAEAVLKLRRAAIQKNWYVVESVTPMVKTYLETFQNDVEKTDRATPQQRRTVSFRASMARGSVLQRSGSGNIGGSIPEGSPVPSPAPGSPMIGSGKSAVWEEFDDLATALKKELRSIDDHFAVLKLEVDLARLLKEGGIQSEVIGSIDKDAIKTEELAAAVGIVGEMEGAGLTLPEAIVKMASVARLVINVRSAVLADQWDTISAMLEETLNGGLGTLPEYTRGEILVVRRELENRWIISNLTSALQTGKLEGELGKANIGNVSCEHLMSYITTAKSLNPRTEFALLLLHTAECIYPLRKLICQAEVDWAAVCKLAKKLLTDVQRQKVHVSVLPELKLVHATAEDIMLCNAMRSALSAGGATGQPGDIDVNTVSTQALEAANKLIARSQLKTEGATHMAYACKVMQELRDNLLLLPSCNEETAYNVWTTVQSQLGAIDATRAANPADTSWNCCAAELDLLRKHAHIEEVKARLLECTVKTSHAYAQRKESDELPPETPPAETDGAAASGLYCSELDAIIEYAKGQQFESEFLERYVGCATTLRLLRSHIVKYSWNALDELLRDPSVRQNLKVLREAEQEIAWVACEYHNHRAVQALSAALRDSSCIPWDKPTEAVLVVSAQGFCANNHILASTLDEVKKYKITSKAGKQLLDCCKNVMQLRQSLLDKVNTRVAEALRWFQANYAICPQHILVEAQQAYVLHQNDLLARSLTAAIAVGKALGPCGELRLDEVQTDHLETLLNQAAEIEPKFGDVEELCEAAAVAVSIRQSLVERDLSTLAAIIDELAEREHFHLLVVDEISTARGEIDNDVTTRALLDSLRSFDDTESKAMELTFMSAGDRTSNDADDSSVKSSPRPNFSILQSFSQRRYSFANKNNANIDPETIDTDVLDQGLRIAEDHGVFSARARALYRTVQLVRSLRVAMKQSDWTRLEEILSHASFDDNVGKKYDAIATKEIQALTSQLEMRAAIVDLAKALKVGWAKCSTGIVDASSLCNDLLENAIDRANRSITELNAGNEAEEGEGGSEEEGGDGADGAGVDGDATPSAEEIGVMKRRVSFVADDSQSIGDRAASTASVADEKVPSLVQKQVDLLMDSARLVLQIREVLLSGKVELAGHMAEEALNGRLHYAVVDELRYYSKEINAALSTMKTFEALRAGILAGSVERLGELINSAKSADSHYSNDLGMVRTLDRAEHVYYSLLEIRKRASALSEVYDTEALRATIEQAVKYNMAERELEQTRGRLDKLLAFEALVEEATQRSHCVLADTASLEVILKHAGQLQLSNHPLAKLAELKLRFVPEAFRTGVVAESVVKRNLYTLATETIRLKRQYLQLPSSATKYALENFPHLRRPQDFGVRMNIASEELRRTMLTHSDQPLPTSLTLQSPVLAALSVTVFTQYVRGIQRNMYSEAGVMLRRMLSLGRAHPPMRDEILLLIIKQMRHNLDVDAVTRLWKCLSACLYHFPPSMLLESYLEQYLIQAGTDSAHFLGYTHCCIRFMHQSIIRFSYDRKIVVDYDKSLEEMRHWFEDGVYDPTASKNAATSPHPPAPSGKGKAASADGGEGSYETADPAFMVAHDKKHGSTHAGGAHGGAAGHAANKSGHTGEEVRGTREDWIARFRMFNSDSTAKEGGHMTKQKFAAAIAASITPEAKLDQFDRDVFYFLLFGKHVSNARAVVREYASADALFHSTSEDEIGASHGRRLWLDAHTPTIDKSSELFFSQLKGPDLGSYAERFWDNIVEKMSVECMHFPFLKWEGDERRKPSIKNGGSDVTINWELYREIVLTGMKKYVDRTKSVRATVSSSAHEDFKLTGFTMHHVDLQTRGK